MAALEPMEEEDAELVTRAQRDPQAFDVLYTRHHPRIYRYVYARVRDHHAAEDVASEVFFKAFAALPRFRPTGRPFLAWLYRIAANTVIDRLRRNEATEAIDSRDWSADECTPETIVIQASEVGLVWAMIDTLPCDQRVALILKYGEDRSTSDIAGRMGRSVGATKVLVHRALMRVRSRVRQAGIGEPL